MRISLLGNVRWEWSWRKNYFRSSMFYSGGKGRTKLEASTHTNHHDPSGQTRKIVTKMQNTEKNRVETSGSKGPAQKKESAPADADDWDVDCRGRNRATEWTHNEWINHPLLQSIHFAGGIFQSSHVPPTHSYLQSLFFLASVFYRSFTGWFT